MFMIVMALKVMCDAHFYACHHIFTPLFTFCVVDCNLRQWQQRWNKIRLICYRLIVHAFPSIFNCFRCWAVCSWPQSRIVFCWQHTRTGRKLGDDRRRRPPLSLPIQCLRLIVLLAEQTFNVLAGPRRIPAGLPGFCLFMYSFSSLSLTHFHGFLEKSPSSLPLLIIMHTNTEE